MSYRTFQPIKSPPRPMPARRIAMASSRSRYVAPSTRRHFVRYRGRLANLQTTAQIDGLGFSLKPPKWLRKAAGRVGRAVSSTVAVAAGTFVPGAGFIIGSRKAPRWLRAPKGVRPYVRKAAKVGLVVAGTAAAVALAPTVIPALTKLAPLAVNLLPKPGGNQAPGDSPTTSGDGVVSYGYGGGGEGGGGGGGGGPDPSMMDPQQEETDAAPAPSKAGGAAFVIGGLALLALMSRRRR